MRHNCIAGRFFHHRPDDDMSRVSTETMTKLLQPVAGFLAESATSSRLPFPAEIPPEESEKVEAFWRDLFGGW